MNLLQFKEKHGLSYRQIQNETSIPATTLFKIATKKDYTVKLDDAMTLVEWSGHEISLESFLSGVTV